MNGVEVLNKIPIYGTVEWALYTMFFLLIAIPLVFIIYSIIHVIHGKHWSIIIENTIFSILLGLFAAILFVVVADKTGISQDKNNVMYYKYQVVVSDEVKFSEFMEKYEILEQNGDIYTIQERN